MFFRRFLEIGRRLHQTECFVILPFCASEPRCHREAADLDLLHEAILARLLSDGPQRGQFLDRFTAAGEIATSGRTEATGRGVMLTCREGLKKIGMRPEQTRVVVQGSGNVGGIAALLGMLTSCASNVTTVNIDNGFGAAHVATLVNRSRLGSDRN